MREPSKEKDSRPKTCFVISPIGANGTETRRRADCVLEYILKPAFKALGYLEPERIDKVDEAGQITLGIIRRIYEADLVVADLSGLNANVFYEIGIRHAFQKPIIHITNDLSTIPFDNANQNTILYVHDDPASHQDAIERIVKQVGALKSKGEQTTTPVSMALGQIKLMNSGDDQATILADVVGRLEAIESRQRRESVSSVGRETLIGQNWLGRQFSDFDRELNVNHLAKHVNVSRDGVLNALGYDPDQVLTAVEAATTISNSRPK